MTTREEFETMLNSLVRMSFPYQADFDPAALLAAYDAQAARITELEAALHTLVDWPDNSEEPGIYDGGYCVYGCFTYEGADDEMHHSSCCPVTLARAVLSKEA